ncbi:MAG: T9SS type A sorting domain-containing protein [Candidatus Cloacimonetes bacterium]|nr:T9SS type A sorting domain-containing protein [Candidatus Cloacimonadota bacterium]
MKFKVLYIAAFILVCLVGGLFGQNNALTFDGVNDCVAIGNLNTPTPQISTQFTMEAWMKPTDVAIAASGNARTYGRTIFASTAGTAKALWVTQRGTEIIVRSFSDNTAVITTTNLSLQAGTWYHVAVSVTRPGDVKLYVNGTPVVNYTGTGKTGTQATTWGSILTIGDLRPGFGGGFYGTIDEVRVWNYVRTAAEISANYDKTGLAPAVGLVGNWKLDENTGSTAYDSVSPAHNGTAQNGSVANPSPAWAPGKTLDDISLPVELSSFTATLTAENYVTVKWITQSETGVSGYYLYRSLGSEWTNAVQICEMINATNTAMQQVYQYTDNELAEDGTYYYWLQVQDLDGTTVSHGPTSVYYSSTGEAPQVPGIVAVSGIKSIYPNPITPYSVISYTLTKAADVKFKIFNSRGQMVNSFVEGFKNDGSYNSRWDGKDSSGNNCPTGIYYIKMQAGWENSMRKVVIIK